MLAKDRGTSFWRKLYFDLSEEVDQVLGKALGYPWYYWDQKNFPGTTPKDGVCTGEHVPESLLAEAAKRISYISPAMFGGYEVKSLVFDESCNVPCTAELEVKAKRLLAYFRKRMKENKKRSEKLEQKQHSFQRMDEIVQDEHSSYYFSGKSEAYENAARKLEELLNEK